VGCRPYIQKPNLSLPTTPSLGNNRQGFSDSHISGLPTISLVHASLGAAPRFFDSYPIRNCRPPECADHAARQEHRFEFTLSPIAFGMGA
jgi:hypothetical protein